MALDINKVTTGYARRRTIFDDHCCALRRDGWEIERERGGHTQLARSTKPGLVTVPRHPGEILKPKTLASILEQAGLTVDDLRGLL